MTTKPKTLNARFKFERSTKGTHVLREVDKAGNDSKEVVGGLYVQKAAMPEAKDGDFFNVTITKE